MYVYRHNLLCESCADLAVLDAIAHATETDPIDVKVAAAIIRDGLAAAADREDVIWGMDMFPVPVPDDTADAHQTCVGCKRPLHDPAADGVTRCR